MSEQKSLMIKAIQGPSRFWHRARQQGLRNAWGWTWYQFQWRWREWRLGFATREYAHGLAVTDQGLHHGYEPIDYLCFDQIIEYLQPIGPADGFLDYGCGMGRAVLLAAMHPWGYVLGVEIDANLADIARRGIRHLRHRDKIRARRVEILVADATTFQVPDNVNRIFLFNSFVGSVLSDTLNQIRHSCLEVPRPMKIVYVQPITDNDPLSELDWLLLEAELPTGYWTHIRSRVYRLINTGSKNAEFH